MNVVPAKLAPTGDGRTRAQDGLLLLGITVLCLLAEVDFLIQAAAGYGLWPTLAVLLIGLTGVLWPATYRPAWLTPALRTAVPALASIALTAATTLDWKAVTGPGEVVILLCLLLVAVRTCPAAWAVTCGVLTGSAIIALPLRGYATEPDGADGALLAYSLLFSIMVAAYAGLGGYLRTLDQRRHDAVTRTRHAERLAMAADLHDFVAHHVTGILVQSQVARMMATTQPEQLDSVLRGIEQAATQALASMRRTVGILRDEGGPSTEPTGDLAALTALVDDFQGPAGPVAELRRDPSVPDDLPHEIQAAAYRVVREALTNVRRHAADATKVTIDLCHDGRTLQITIHDDGHGTTRLPVEAHGGGFGLVGLTERVTTLGGHLHAGPDPIHGWTLTAHLPTA